MEVCEETCACESQQLQFLLALSDKLFRLSFWIFLVCYQILKILCLRWHLLTTRLLVSLAK